MAGVEIPFRNKNKAWAGAAPPALSLASIHRSAWKVDSAKFAPGFVEGV